MAGGITPRPRVGRAYTASTAQCEEAWRKNELLGGRRLYVRLIASFIVACTVGAIFITLGAVYWDEAQTIHDENKTSLPLVWCISGIVGGGVLIGGSLVLAKIILSNKWVSGDVHPSPSRRRQQPARVHYAVSSNDTEPSVDLNLPPAYDEVSNAVPPFTVSGGTAPMDTVAPPPYTEVILKPPEYALQDPWMPPALEDNENSTRNSTQNSTENSIPN